VTRPLRDPLFADLDRILANDFFCQVDDLYHDEVSVVTVADPGEPRRIYPPRALSAISLAGPHHRGQGLQPRASVYTAQPSLAPAVKRAVAVGQLPGDPFSEEGWHLLQGFCQERQLTVYRPQLKFVAAPDPLQRPPAPSLEGTVRPLANTEIARLETGEGFPHALGGLAKTTLAWGFITNGEVVSVAGASEDGPNLHQVGVDTKSAFSGRGIASMLVYQITKDLLRRRRLIYYSTTIDNKASQAVALKIGYHQYWYEVYTEDR